MKFPKNSAFIGAFSFSTLTMLIPRTKTTTVIPMNTTTAIKAIQNQSRTSIFIKNDKETYGHGELIQLIYGLIHQGATRIDGVSIIEAKHLKGFNLTHDVVVNGPNINALFQSSGNIKFIDVHFNNQ